MSSATDSRIEQVPERWTYLGRRELQRGGLGAMYEMLNGETALFKSKRPPAVVGGIYEVTVVREDGNPAIVGPPKFLEAPDPDDPNTARWEAEDRAARTADVLRKAEAKTARTSTERFAQLTLADLRELYLRQTGLRAAALIGQVLRFIGAS